MGGSNCSNLTGKILLFWISGRLLEVSLGKQPTFGNATTGFPAKWRLRNERRNSILMTCHYPDLGSASDWLNQISHAARPIKSTTQIWVVTCLQYGISALVSQTSFRVETSFGVARCRLCSQANWRRSHMEVRLYIIIAYFFSLVLWDVEPWGYEFVQIIWVL